VLEEKEEAPVKSQIDEVTKANAHQVDLVDLEEQSSIEIIDTPDAMDRHLEFETTLFVKESLD
jgi:hypothetical protein